MSYSATPKGKEVWAAFEGVAPYRLSARHPVQSPAPWFAQSNFTCYHVGIGGKRILHGFKSKAVRDFVLYWAAYGIRDTFWRNGLGKWNDAKVQIEDDNAPQPLAFNKKLHNKEPKTGKLKRTSAEIEEDLRLNYYLPALLDAQDSGDVTKVFAVLNRFPYNTGAYFSMMKLIENSGLSAQPFKDFAAYRDALVYQEPQTDAEIALIHEILLDDRRTSEEMSKRMAEHFKTKAEKKNA